MKVINALRLVGLIRGSLLAQSLQLSSICLTAPHFAAQQLQVTFTISGCERRSGV
jgi:hypothetical protein